MAVELTWLGHASFRVSSTHVVYIDPWKIDTSPHDGNLTIVSHPHHDHCSDADIAKVARDDAELLAPPDAIEEIGRGYAASPGEKVTLCGVDVETVAAYNIDKKFHPQENNWLGVVISMAGTRVYYAGDTDAIPVMSGLRNIDIALLPVGGTYTMDAEQAAQACRRIRPTLAIPYHWGDIVGTAADAQAFADAAPCNVRILQPGHPTALG